jgi:hypothetical protein
MKDLEEAAANLVDPNACKTDNWIAGAKYVAEIMYSKEIIDILDNVRYWETCPNEYIVIIEKFIEPFKNK